MGRAKWLVVACVLSLILVLDGGARTPEEIPHAVPSPVLVSQLTGAKSPARTEERWTSPGRISDSASSTTAGSTWHSAIPGAGAAKLLRVDQHQLLDQEQYEYWDGDEWSPDASQAAEVVPAPVGELSVRWSRHHKQWLMMYRNEATGLIVLRTAEWLTGPWDEERTVVTTKEYPSNYAPFMLPITGTDVYFAMSMFKPDYQVYLMRLPL